MRSMLLDHYVDAKRVLRYDPESGSSEVLQREQIPEHARTAFGFFTTAGNTVWGVYASPTGPILFRDRERFRLADPSTQIEIAEADGQNRFVLRQAGSVQAQCDYPRPSPSDWGYDSWSTEEESADFFLWLKHQLTTEDFIERYTRPE